MRSTLVLSAQAGPHVGLMYHAHRVGWVGLWAIGILQLYSPWILEQPVLEVWTSYLDVLFLCFWPVYLYLIDWKIMLMHFHVSVLDLINFANLTYIYKVVFLLQLISSGYKGFGSRYRIRKNCMAQQKFFHKGYLHFHKFDTSIFNFCLFGISLNVTSWRMMD